MAKSSSLTLTSFDAEVLYGKIAENFSPKRFSSSDSLSFSTLDSSYMSRDGKQAYVLAHDFFGSLSSD